ncbi:uncharacterized protein At4g06744-like [Dendrobium catenatum]|uniref:uncharacterized protein At4g06744-like n=1 Tax=Dendrobium catenatum TaxID=906689 RepID=UPI00109F77E1|nr:uncharacterized protein At4g06744-like [Dendrobium catenatum]
MWLESDHMNAGAGADLRRKAWARGPECKWTTGFESKTHGLRGVNSQADIILVGKINGAVLRGQHLCFCVYLEPRRRRRILRTNSSSRPHPCDFSNEKQFLAYKVIQRFKKTITCDPRNITQTWSGYRPCTYRGFFFETPPGLTNTPTIASIDFNGYRLCSPALTGFVDNLPDLALFHANSNNFSGTVPNLSNLPFLYELDVSNNHLSGNFPTNVLRLSNLTFLDIRFNRFAGSVPGFIFTLRLDYLCLNNNQFDQPLPADIGNSPVMYLTLANNGFTGPLPPSICNASNTLLEVLFLNNHLSGCLPAEIGSLKKATVFDAGYNQLTGTIPSSFACLLKIEQLNLAVNKLYGEVPDALCRLADVGRLLNLSLSQNYFTKIGPCC